MSVYCNNENCQYYDDGCCEYAGSIVIDDGGFCTTFMYKLEVANEIICNNFCLDSNTSTTTKPHGCWCCMFRHTCRE